jgi:hypothetical protein
LLQYKTPLDAAKTAAEAENVSWTTMKEDLAAKTTAFAAAKTAWDNRDQANDGQAGNNALETTKNDA